MFSAPMSSGTSLLHGGADFGGLVLCGRAASFHFLQGLHGDAAFPAGFVLAGFSDASARDGVCRRGASRGIAGAVRAHQKGRDLQRRHSPHFFVRRNRLGKRLDVEFFLSGGTPMDQREFPLLGRLDAPSAVPMQWIKHAKTYRHAVRLAWSLRRVQNMTRQQLATEAELYPQHVTDYLAEDDKPSRRDLPADAVARFEAVVGNTLVSQWLASQSKLTVLEQVQATAEAA